MFTNVLVVSGSALCILADNIDTVETSNVILYFGRFFYGLAAGSYSVFCPKYISETSPVEIKGPTGFMTQINVCLGILLAYIVGICFTEQQIHENKDDRNITLWVLWTVPILLAIL